MTVDRCRRRRSVRLREKINAEQEKDETRLGLVINVAVPAQAPVGAHEPPSYILWEFGTMPRSAFKVDLLGVPAVQEELKLTAAQQAKIENTSTRRFEKLRKARSEITDPKKLGLARDEINNEARTAALNILEPAQRSRPYQTQLQIQGPLAFDKPRLELWDFDDDTDLARRLNLSDDQVKRIRQIAAEGDNAIDTPAAVPIVLDPRDGAPTVETNQSPTHFRETGSAARPRLLSWVSGSAPASMSTRSSERDCPAEFSGPVNPRL
jgi:hypothetical protein